METMIYRNFKIEKNAVGWYEAFRDDLESFLWAKTLNEMKIIIDEFYE